MISQKQTDKHIPYPIIASAAGGDTDAINAVLGHYEGYIAVLATKRFHDKQGNPCICVDEWIKRRLETKLIMAILTFDVA